MDDKAKKALVLTLLAGYRSSARSADEEQVAVYLETLKPFHLDSVAHAVKRFLSGEVPSHNNGFVPTVPELAAQVRLFDGILHPAAEPPMLNGLASIDFGQGRIDMRGLTAKQQDTIMAGKGFIDGQNAARLPRPELLARLNGTTIENVKRKALPDLRVKRMDH